MPKIVLRLNLDLSPTWSSPDFDWSYCTNTDLLLAHSNSRKIFRIYWGSCVSHIVSPQTGFMHHRRSEFLNFCWNDFFKIYSMFFTSSTELYSFSRSRDHFVWPFPSVYLDSLSNKLLLDNLDVHIMGAHTLLSHHYHHYHIIVLNCHLDWHSRRGPRTLTGHSARHHVPDNKLDQH